MIHITLPAEAERVSVFLEVVERFAQELAFPPSRIQRLVLVLEEALLNVVRYAYGGEAGGDVDIRCWGTEVGMSLEVRDRGRPFDPLSVPDPDLSKGVAERPVGGLGIFLIKKMADEVSYRREDETNILTMVFRKDREK